MYQMVSNVSHQAGNHAIRGGVDFIYNDDTITYPAIGTRGIHVFVSCEFSFGGLQHVWVYSDVRSVSVSQTNPNSAFICRTSGRCSRP